jgi:hypothetical protein
MIKNPGSLAWANETEILCNIMTKHIGPSLFHPDPFTASLDKNRLGRMSPGHV